MHPDAGPAPAAVGAYILAGGRSVRMGRDKHALPLDGAPLVAHLAAMARPHVAHVWLVGKPDTGLENFGLPVLHDPSPEPALAHGIRAAIRAPGPEWRWLLACDMPAVDAAVLAGLWRAARDAGAPGSAPKCSEDAPIEPLPSLWHRDTAACLQDERVVAARALVECAGLATWTVPAAARGCLANLNTPSEWEEWRCRRAAERDQR